jgi:hypothetical protein
MPDIRWTLTNPSHSAYLSLEDAEGGVNGTCRFQLTVTDGAIKETRCIALTRDDTHRLMRELLDLNYGDANRR